MTRTASVGVMVVALMLSRPATAWACSCGGPIPSSLAARGADVVFAGTVTRIVHPLPTTTAVKGPFGLPVMTGGVISVDPDRVVFDVAHVYKGSPVSQFLLRGNECNLPFRDGEKWLVYASESDGGIKVFGCSRTRLYADAAQDVIYLENVEQRRPEGIVYGTVFRRRDGAEGVALYALDERLRIVAANASARFSTTTDRWGPFELVLPPGDFEIWVERSDKAVAARRMIHVDNAADLNLQLIVEYDAVRNNRMDR